MCLDIKGNYWNALQSAVLLTQQWSTVLLKPTRLGVSVGGLYKLESRRNRFQQMYWQVSASRQRRREPSSFYCPYVDLQQKIWLRLKLCTYLDVSCFFMENPLSQAGLELRDLHASVSLN